MQIQRNNSRAILLSFCILSLGVVSGFQHNMRPSSSLSQMPVRKTVNLHLNTPPQYDDDDFDSSPFGEPTMDNEQPLPDTGIPKLKLPTPSFDMPELDFKEILIRFASLVATVVAFAAIQKLGLMASEVLTPELTAEQVKDFRL